MEDTLLKNLNYLICKCHAKILMSQHEQYTKVQNELSSMKMDDGEATKLKQVKFDNLYDVLFTH
jgi:hypothetical protein